ncbi:hypothetical protein D3C80_2074290 [compost metagenome]
MGGRHPANWLSIRWQREPIEPDHAGLLLRDGGDTQFERGVVALGGCENIERRREVVSRLSRQGVLREKWGSLGS